MGAIGTGAPLVSDWGGGGGLGVRNLSQGRRWAVAVCGRSSFGVGQLISVSGPDVLWGRDALNLTCDPVCSDAGLDVRRLKCLYDPRGVKRIFTFSDWTVRYCPLAVTCKFDSPWLSSYLFVS